MKLESFIFIKNSELRKINEKLAMTSQFEFNSVLSSYNPLFGFLTRFSNAHYRILSKLDQSK